MRIDYSVESIFLPFWNHSKWFLEHKETCELLIDYQTLGGEDIKYHVMKAISSLLYANIYVNIRRLISELLGYGVKFISKLQYHCANMTFTDKSRYDSIFQKLSHKGGEWVMNYINSFQFSQALSVSVDFSYFKGNLMKAIQKIHQVTLKITEIHWNW